MSTTKPDFGSKDFLFIIEDAMRQGLEKKCSLIYDEEVKRINERLERERKEHIASMVLTLMSQVDYERNGTTLVIRVREDK